MTNIALPAELEPVTSQVCDGHIQTKPRESPWGPLFIGILAGAIILGLGFVCLFFRVLSGEGFGKFSADAH